MGVKTHRILVWTAAMQVWPSWLIAVVLTLFAGVVALFWPDSNIAVTYLAVCAFNWTALWLLPKFNRSRGPEKASTLALAVAVGIPLAILGLLRASELIALIWMIGVTIIALYATWVEPFALKVTHQTKRIDGWESSRPLRLLHIGDLHAEHFGPRERHLNQLVKQLEPDVVVFTGDFINLSYVRDDSVRQAVRDIVCEWTARLGLYAVSGTSPEIETPEDVNWFLDGVPDARSVVGRWFTVDTPGGPLHIGGIATRHRMNADHTALASLLKKRPKTGASVLLVHTPDLAPQAAESGINLYLCGHTHGGQICLPGGFPLLTGSHLGRRFVRGRNDLGATTVYTTSGVGLEGLGAPRARLFCRPEITLWELTS